MKGVKNAHTWKENSLDVILSWQFWVLHSICLITIQCKHCHMAIMYCRYFNSVSHSI